MKKNLALVIIFFFFLGFLSGCSWNQEYGKLWVGPASKERLTPNQLYEQWENYHIYYAGVSISQPTAILFDPKDDKRKIETHEYWAPVKKREELWDLIGHIQTSQYQYPVMKSILGPGNAFYGYLYTNWTHVVLKVIDQKTLWIDYLNENPLLGVRSSLL